MNIVCIGAHPDDGEVFAGGTLIKWAAAGHRVWAVSVTNGDVGHHAIHGEALARRRAEEAARAAEIGGYEARNLGVGDGTVLPTLALREAVTRLIRQCAADIVLTHRPWDYHPDHRHTAVTVQDAAYMVCVPYFCPDAPALPRNPVFVHMMDRFTRPCPFQPDIAVDVGDVMDRRWNVLDAMDSQFYEWLPWMDGRLDEVPSDPDARRAWLRAAWDPFFRAPADAARPLLRKRYGDRGDTVAYAELFEICEYGRQPTPEELEELFPT